MRKLPDDDVTKDDHLDGESDETSPLHSHERDEEDLIEEDVDEVDFDTDEDDHY